MGKTALLLDELLDRAALATRRFPYLMQLIGYYVIQYTPDGGTVDASVMDKAEKSAMGDMEKMCSNLFLFRCRTTTRYS